MSRLSATDRSTAGLWLVFFYTSAWFVSKCTSFSGYANPSRPVFLPKKIATTTTTVLFAGSSSSDSSASVMRDAKLICTFDEDDFAGKQSDWPYTSEDMKRADEQDDVSFYSAPRFVTHIDDAAIASLTKYYKQVFEQEQQKKRKTSKKSSSSSSLDILDLCSSWISHLPTDLKYGNVVGIGMVAEELEENKQLTKFYTQDLNKNPTLKDLPDNSFDVVCNVVSVDYLTQPQSIFQEMYRVLRPGGLAVMSFSNRCFATKAINMWLDSDDIGRLTIVASYFYYSDRQWKELSAFDLKNVATLTIPERPSFGDMFRDPAAGFAWMNTATAVARTKQGDPMYVVQARK